MERRSFLTAASTALSVPALAGCVASPPARDADTADTATDDAPTATATEPSTGTTRTATHSRTATADAPSLDDSRGPVRGESNAAVETRVTEDDEHTTYLPDENAVQYVAAWRSTNRDEQREGKPPEREPVYETVPWEEWAHRQCLTAAAAAGADHVEAETGVGVGHGITASVEDRDVAAFVSVSALLDRDGEVIDRAALEFERLVATTPASVDATYVLADREYAATVPVYATYRVAQQA